ncbi:acyl carrier protein [Streptomyces sp. NPDC050147]|uniref:acyl carrier protein n=1 Tax=Streptomyces sp. NPDC050147 TaxID=3155513 RepID=UPI003431E648
MRRRKPDENENDLSGPVREGDPEAVQQLCARVLSVGEVGAGNNFVGLGGDSITAMKLATACRREGIAVRSVRFLTADTLADTLPRPEVNAAR